ALKMNAIVFHIRPGADALYESKLEPWSQYLSGRQGRAPEPQYDPLAFAIEESHKRGLELHAWFNPYRAHYSRDTLGAASTHVMRTDPDLVRQYSRFIWMDPGDPDHRRRRQALRRRRRAHRRLFLSVSGERRVGKEDRLPGFSHLRSVSSRGWKAREGRLATSQCRPHGRSDVQGCARREALGEGGHQSVRHLASRQSGADSWLRRVRRDLCRLEEVAAEWLARLSGAAALLADRASGAELSRAARVVG